MNKKERKLMLPAIYTSLFLIIYIILFIYNLNFNLLFFIAIMAVSFLALVLLDEYFDFPLWLIWMGLISVTLHIFGATLVIEKIFLYDYIIFNLIGNPFYILRYDQVVHLYSCFAVTLFLYFMIKAKNKTVSKWDHLFIILAALGAGAANELIEFSLVVFFDATGIGDYYNNSLDMVFDLVGILFGFIFYKYFLEKNIPVE